MTPKALRFGRNNWKRRIDSGLNPFPTGSHSKNKNIFHSSYNSMCLFSLVNMSIIVSRTKMARIMTVMFDFSFCKSTINIVPSAEPVTKRLESQLKSIHVAGNPWAFLM
jgi:hypothetical protein